MRGRIAACSERLPRCEVAAVSPQSSESAAGWPVWLCASTARNWWAPSSKPAILRVLWAAAKTEPASAPAVAKPAAKKPKRKLSAEGRKRIALSMLNHKCPAKYFIRSDKILIISGLERFLACRDLKGDWPQRLVLRRPTVVREPGPHGVFSVVEFPARSRVSPLCHSVQRRRTAARLLLLGSILAMAFAQLTYRDGLRDIEACLRCSQLAVTGVTGFKKAGPWNKNAAQCFACRIWNRLAGKN
jgi:hypothetical protein